MRRFSATFERLLASANATLITHEKQFGEDTIDWLHRLAQQDLNAHEIAQITEVPYVSVEYWMHSNGYDCDDFHAASGVRRGGVLAGR